MLSPREIDIDRIAIEVRELATVDRLRNSTCQSDAHGPRILAAGHVGSPNTVFAILIASFNAADLLIVSSYSRAGSES